MAVTGLSVDNAQSLKNGSRTNGVSKATALRLYREMRTTRLAEEALIREYHPADEMRCPVHFCVGQEASSAGVCLNLRQDDYTFVGHRSHGYYLAKGGSLKALFAELYGKSTGTNAGKAGSMEICDETINFYSGAILVGTVPIAAGAALATQMRGEDRVSIAVFGDGGADQGIVYETLNLAVLKRLPIVFICENNQYSTHSRQSARHGLCDIAGRARAFGMPGRRMYGNDAIKVYLAAKRAIARARSGHGPSLLELETYRWCSHVGPEDDDYMHYRSPEELSLWKQRCPIESLQKTLVGRGILNSETIDRLDREINSEIEDAFRFAKSSPFPEPDALLTDVFADRPQQHIPSWGETVEVPFDFHQPEAVPKPY